LEAAREREKRKMEEITRNKKSTCVWRTNAVLVLVLVLVVVVVVVDAVARLKVGGESECGKDESFTAMTGFALRLLSIPLPPRCLAGSCSPLAALRVARPGPGLPRRLSQNSRTRAHRARERRGKIHLAVIT